MPKPLRALIVEDSADDAELLVRELKRGGFEPEWLRVETSAEMKKALEGKKWDIVFADYKLPAFSAPKALEVLKKTGIDLPFIIVSGTVGEEAVVESLKAGAHDYFKKDKMRLLSAAVERELEDVVDRRERRRAEQEYDRLFNLSIDMLCVAGFDGRFRQLNPAFEVTLGWTRQELMSKPCLDFIHPDDRKATIKTQEDLMSGNPALSLENRYICKDGSYRWISWNSYPLVEEKLIFSVGRDVTNIMRAQKTILEREMKYRALFESSRDAIMTLAPPSWNFTSCNPAAVEMFGTGDEATFISLNPWQLSPETQPDGRPSADKAKEMIEIAMRKGSNFFEWTHKRLKGGDFPVTVLLARMSVGGQDFLQATVRDITEQKRTEVELRKNQKELSEWSRTLEEKVCERTVELERAQQKLVEHGRLAVLGQVSASLSHELRTPLTGIRNSVYLMQMLGVEKHDPKIAESMAIINMEIDACARVLNNMLDFVMPKAPMPKETRLDVIINNMLSTLFIPSNVKVSKMFQEGLPPLMIDALQMQQAFENIIKNALEAMSMGGELAISAKVSGDRVVVEFSDTGVGISHENLGKLFDPLFSTTPTGVGLGLTIARQLVDAHGGTIEASSQPGKGTTFTIKLPIK